MNNKDFFVDKQPLYGDFTSEKPDTKDHSQDFFPNQSLPPMMNFPQQQFMGNFMNMPPPNGMYFPSYGNQYMNYGYNYMQPQYQGHKPFYKRGYHGQKKNYSPGSNRSKVIYARKPKLPEKVDGDFIVEDFKKLTIKEIGTSDNAENKTEKPTSDLQNARFFVIKSFCEDDVHKAIKYNLWCSTRDGNVKLHDAFVAANNQYPIFLLFSVNASGHFLGIAQMKSPVDFEKNFPGWNQSQKWKGVFSISWIYIKDVPNRELKHLKNELNEDKPVPNSRDTQEVPFDVGCQVLKIFEGYKNQTSILDDFEFYEMKETKKEA